MLRDYIENERRDSGDMMKNVSLEKIRYEITYDPSIMDFVELPRQIKSIPGVHKVKEI